MTTTNKTHLHWSLCVQRKSRHPFPVTLDYHPLLHNALSTDPIQIMFDEHLPIVFLRPNNLPI